VGTPSPPHGFNEILSYNHILEVGGEADLYICGWAWGGGDVGEQIIVIAISHEEYFQYMFLLHYFIKSMVWGRGVGGRRICLFSSSVHVWVGGGGGVGCGLWVTKTAF
jgi:hypothetical protein